MTAIPTDWLWGLAGGLIIGSAAALYLLVNGRIMGASGILGSLVEGSAGKAWAEPLAFTLALVISGGVFAAILGRDETNADGNLLILAIAGVLVGLGTRLAKGCTSGHGVCGVSRLSPRGIIATAIYLGMGFVTMALARHLFGVI